MTLPAEHERDEEAQAFTIPVVRRLHAEREAAAVLQTRPAPAARARAQVRSFVSEYATSLRLYATSRLLVLAAAIASLAVQRHPARGPWPGVGGPRVGLLQLFARWDGAWYLEIVRHGYRTASFPQGRRASTAFFPGYPIFVRLVGTATRAPALVAAVALNVVLGAIVAVLAWRLVDDLAGPAAARRAVAMLCFAPAAFVLSMTYSEPLFLTFVLASLLLLERRRYVLAGAFAAAASFTRPNGVALVAACLVVAIDACLHERNRRAIAAVLIAPVGVIAYFAFLWAHTGSPGMWFAAEHRGWSDRLAPIGSLTMHMQRLVANAPSLQLGGLTAVAWLLGTLATVAGVVLLLRWRPPLPVLAYGLFAAAFAATSYQIGLTPRMLLLAFPLLLAAGVVLHGRTFRAVLAVSAALLVVSTVLTFTTLSLVP